MRKSIPEMILNIISIVIYNDTIIYNDDRFCNKETELILYFQHTGNVDNQKIRCKNQKE